MAWSRHLDGRRPSPASSGAARRGSAGWRSPHGGPDAPGVWASRLPEKTRVELYCDPSTGGATTVGEETKVPISRFLRKANRYLQRLHDRPVLITERGEPVAAVIAIDEFRALMELEERARDLYWTAVALRAEWEWRREGKPLVSLDEVERRSHAGD